ncbi:GNAT family N-acetyltransferase [Roseomonas sp. GCM10028921]
MTEEVETLIVMPDVAGHGEPSPWLRYLAEEMRIHAHTASERLRPASEPFRYDEDELAIFTGEGPPRLRKGTADSPNPLVWYTRDEAEFVAAAKALAPSAGPSTGWKLLTDPELVAPLEDACRLVAVASREGTTPEGLFACRRQVLIIAPEDDDEVSIDYHLTLDLIYVAPDARRHGLARSLTAAICEAAADDLEVLREAHKRVGPSVRISIWVEGDTHSPGGEKAATLIHSFLEQEVGQYEEGIFNSPVPDWST